MVNLRYSFQNAEKLYMVSMLYFHAHSLSLSLSLSLPLDFFLCVNLVQKYCIPKMYVL
jgi:hypothetical protein